MLLDRAGIATGYRLDSIHIQALLNTSSNPNSLSECSSKNRDAATKLISAENPFTRRKEAATAREGGELCIGVEIQGTSYEFIIDTGADVRLVQPYVGDEPTKEIGDAVRGITGQELEI
jgi:hypothetical protein